MKINFDNHNKVVKYEYNNLKCEAHFSYCLFSRTLCKITNNKNKFNIYIKRKKRSAKDMLSPTSNYEISCNQKILIISCEGKLSKITFNSYQITYLFIEPKKIEVKLNANFVAIISYTDYYLIVNRVTMTIFNELDDELLDIVVLGFIGVCCDKFLNSISSDPFSTLINPW